VAQRASALVAPPNVGHVSRAEDILGAVGGKTGGLAFQRVEADFAQLGHQQLGQRGRSLRGQFDEI